MKIKNNSLLSSNEVEIKETPYQVPTLPKGCHGDCAPVKRVRELEEELAQYKEALELASLNSAEICDTGWGDYPCPTPKPDHCRGGMEKAPEPAMCAVCFTSEFLTKAKVKQTQLSGKSGQLEPVNRTH